MSRRLAALVPVLALLAALPAGAAAAPIPRGPTAGDPANFTGRVATPRRIRAPRPPRHPFMAPNGRSNLHNDGYQTDTYWSAGPLGAGGMTTASTLQNADCASVTFDSRGRIVTVCVGLQGPRLVLMDPQTLATLATMNLPPRIPGGGNVLTDFSAGGYFYLDNRDRAILATTTRHLYVVQVNADPGFTLERNYDLTDAVPSGDKIISALPDWSGRIWFATVGGRVGTLRGSGVTHVRALGEEIANSFAVDASGAVYIVTAKALYRFDSAANGAPSLTWREVYKNSGIAKPGQVGAGSGTTPTVMTDGRVAITDNADPMNVVVYRAGPGGSGARKLCERPVFERGASATDNSLIAAGDSLVVENNYGYTVLAVGDGKSTSPGLERIDVVPGGGCRRVWRSAEIAPSVVPKLSVETGLVYTYTKPAGDEDDPWYFTALDFCTGRTVYKRLSGTGLGHNNHYAPVSLGPDGTAYVGALGGLQLLRDTTRPRRPARSARQGCPGPRRIRLRLRYKRSRDDQGRRCARGRVRARIRGSDRRFVLRARFRIGKGRRRNDRSFPFSRIVDRGRQGGPSKVRRVKAKVRMRDGWVVRLSRRYRACRDG